MLTILLTLLTQSLITKNEKSRKDLFTLVFRLCEPDRIRTYDRLLRREVLYPAELRARSIKIKKNRTF